MALDKNKSGIMAAISAATEGQAPIGKNRAHRALPKGTVGSVRAGLGGIQDIDTALVLPWGPQDRLELTAVNSAEADVMTLADSIRASGQQVPVLLRPSREHDGKFEVIYGRRRLAACAKLGLKVRANVQDLDNATALLAKGLENAARRNLSFYEKARFASEILKAGHDTKTVRKVLNLSASGLSHLTKVTDNVPEEIGAQIGAAPKSGRPKWTALADAFIAHKINAPAAFAILALMDDTLSSDDRLENLLKEIARRGARPGEGREVTPVKGVTIKSGRATTTVSIKRAGENAAFATWLDHKLSDIIKKSYAEFTAVNTADDTTTKTNKRSS